MRLRLVKVVCQAQLVLEDDDGNLSELVAEPVAVPAKDWPEFSGTIFPRELERLKAEMGADPDSEAAPDDA